MNSFLKDFYRDERGAMAAIVALMLLVLLGFGALAIDMSFAGSTRTELQVTASAAAMAGVQSINEADPTDSEYREAAVEFTYRNMPGAGNGNLVEANCGTYDPVGGTVNGSTECSDVKVGHWAPATIPGARGTFTAHDDGFDTNTMVHDAVRVRAHRSDANGNPLNLFLAPVVGLAKQDVNVSAVAWAEESIQEFCMVALDPSVEKAFHVQGTADLDSDGCGVCVNSTDPGGFWANGTPEVNLQVEGGPLGSITVNNAEGDYVTKGNTSLNPEPVAGGACYDPFADEVPEEFAPYFAETTCTTGTAGTAYTGSDFADGLVEVSPGTHCGGLKFNATGDVVFLPGIHHIKNGDLAELGSHTFDGQGVTFLCDNCTIDFGGAQSNTLLAPALVDPPTADPDLLSSKFLIYEPPGTPHPSEEHIFRGDANAIYEGYIYVPDRDSRFVGTTGGNLLPPQCFAVIANTFFFTGTSEFYVGSEGCGGDLELISVTYRLVD